MPSPEDPRRYSPSASEPLPQPSYDELLQQAFDAHFGVGDASVGLDTARGALGELTGWAPGPDSPEGPVAEIVDLLSGLPEAFGAISRDLGAVAQRLGGLAFEAGTVVRGDVEYKRVLRLNPAVAAYINAVAARADIAAEQAREAEALFSQHHSGDMERLLVALGRPNGDFFDVARNRDGGGAGSASGGASPAAGGQSSGNTRVPLTPAYRGAPETAGSGAGSLVQGPGAAPGVLPATQAGGAGAGRPPVPPRRSGDMESGSGEERPHEGRAGLPESGHTKHAASGDTGISGGSPTPEQPRARVRYRATPNVPPRSERPPLYRHEEAEKVLGIQRKLLTHLSMSNLLLSLKIGNSEPRFVSEYVAALGRAVTIAAQERDYPIVTRVARDVALSGIQPVEAMMEDFSQRLAELTTSPYGTLDPEGLMALMGWASVESLHDVGLGSIPTVADVRRLAQWRHTLLEPLKLYTNGDVAAKLEVTDDTVRNATNEGELLGFRLQRRGKPRAGKYWYPAVVVDFEVKQARAARAAGELSQREFLVDKTGGRSKTPIRTARDNLDRLVQARFWAHIERETNADGRIPLARAAGIMGYSRRRLRSYGLHTDQQGIPIASLRENIEWSRPIPPERPLPPGIFESSED